MPEENVVTEGFINMYPPPDKNLRVKLSPILSLRGFQETTTATLHFGHFFAGSPDKNPSVNTYGNNQRRKRDERVQPIIEEHI
jgi:hypothetical protein